MPLYEFACPCGLHFSSMLPKGTKQAPCTSCARTAERKPSVFGSSLRGRGYHETDYPTFDRAVGIDADLKHKIFDNRKSSKRKLQDANPDKPLVRDDSGNYGLLKG